MLGVPKISYHQVEFIPGTGMVIDGIVNANSLYGPWNWTVPEDFSGKISIDCYAGGGGGAGGGNVNAVANVFSVGGGGGGAAYGIINYTSFHTFPGETLTITVGAAGVGGGIGESGGQGGTSSVLAPNNTINTGCGFRSLVANISQVFEAVASNGSYSNTSGTGAAAGNGQQSPVNGYINTGSYEYTQPFPICINLLNSGLMYGWVAPGGGGGAGNGTTNGGNGSPFADNLNPAAWIVYTQIGNSAFFPSTGLGNNNGTVSFGGGAGGSPLPGFISGNGGNGNTAGGNAPGLVAGGGGGGGNAPGGNGGDGYVVIRYWSV
jgi:hypothetical protein